ncbi:hypothetical protein ACIPLC_09940 [Kitasatospora sp. NPDC086801]|uniref:hypothetical protein n=1 Tax=Kitasatospora sp. NPDC086801 TaxID=3364066 RepID=UPI0037FE3F13
MRDAQAGATASPAELRDLIRGISPPVLNGRGIVDAVRALALDVPLDVAVSAGAPLRLDPPIESAVYFGVYFGVAELPADAVRHAGASRARISPTRDGTEGLSSQAVGRRLLLGESAIGKYATSMSGKLGISEDDANRRVRAVLTYLNKP